MDEDPYTGGLYTIESAVRMGRIRVQVLGADRSEVPSVIDIPLNRAFVVGVEGPRRHAGAPAPLAALSLFGVALALVAVVV